MLKGVFVAALGLMLGSWLLLPPEEAGATHSWGSYHWARTSNPFTLKLGDNVSSTWDSYLATTSSDWSQSTLLDTAIVAGSTTGRQCKPTSGQVQVCNASYGKNGWLGLASIWASGSHIVQGTAKLNDTYFNTATYNTPAWRQFVMCQEVAHTFGLGHQDENFSNPNLGSCMDYTRDPDGPPSNEHPNAHDYDQLATIYAHLDSTTTVGQSLAAAGRGIGVGPDEEDDHGLPPGAGPDKGDVYVRDHGNGLRQITHVTWEENVRPRGR